MLAQTLLILASLASLQDAPPATRPAVDPAAVAEAHGRSKIPADAVFHGRITVQFGENKLLDDAELWFKPRRRDRADRG